jgi:oligopeptide transport system ATP-binding protein
MSALLEVENLTVALATRAGYRNAVDDLSLTVAAGEVVGIAGESGSGKTMTALSLFGLLPSGARVTGSARLDGTDLLKLRGRRLRDVRGRQVAMVSQDPSASLHPILTIGTQLTEHMRHHLGVSKAEAASRAAALLDTVRIPDPERALAAYPGQFSGGMRQRIAIAVALAAEPRLLVADEPTTALDVTVQAGILRLLDRLCRERGLSVIVITHDLGVMSALARRVYVMYAGRLAEAGDTSRLLTRPRHPYTRGLLDALPHPEAGNAALVPIGGTPPSLGAVPGGCPFHPRCAHAEPSCATGRPDAVQASGEGTPHLLACPPDPLRDLAQPRTRSIP